MVRAGIGSEIGNSRLDRSEGGGDQGRRNISAGSAAYAVSRSPRQLSVATTLFHYDVSRDGQRFLIDVAFEESEQSPVTIVLNWQAELGR